MILLTFQHNVNIDDPKGQRLWVKGQILKLIQLSLNSMAMIFITYCKYLWPQRLSSKFMSQRSDVKIYVIELQFNRDDHCVFLNILKIILNQFVNVWGQISCRCHRGRSHRLNSRSSVSCSCSIFSLLPFANSLLWFVDLKTRRM